MTNREVDDKATSGNIRTKPVPDNKPAGVRIIDGKASPDDKTSSGNADNKSEKMAASSKTTGKRAFFNPKDKGWSWVILAGVFVIQVNCIGFLRMFGVVFVPMQEKFGASSSSVSLVFGIQAAVYSISALVALTVLAEKMSVRNITRLGALFCFVGLTLCFTSKSVAFFYFSQSVMCGIGLPMCFGTGFVLLSMYFDRRRALAMAIANTGGSVGTLLMPLVTRLLLEEYALMGTYLLLGAIFVQNFVVAGFFTPPEDYKPPPEADNSDKTVDKAASRGKKDVIVEKSGGKHGRPPDSTAVDFAEMALLGSTTLLDGDEEEENNEEESPSDDLLSKNRTSESQTTQGLEKCNGNNTRKPETEVNNSLTSQDMTPADVDGVRQENGERSDREGEENCSGTHDQDVLNEKEVATRNNKLNLRQDLNHTNGLHAPKAGQESTEQTLNAHLLNMSEQRLFTYPAEVSADPDGEFRHRAYSEGHKVRVETEAATRNGNAPAYRRQRQNPTSESSHHADDLKTPLTSETQMTPSSKRRSHHTQPNSGSIVFLSCETTYFPPLDVTKAVTAEGAEGPSDGEEDEGGAHTASKRARGRVSGFCTSLCDASLLRSPIFYLLMAFQFFGILGMSMTGSFLPPLALEKGLTLAEASLLLTVLGTVDIFSRLIPGFLAQMGWLRPQTMVCACYLLMGIVFQLTAFFNSLGTMMCISIVNGIGSGCYTSMQQLITIDFVGLHRFPKAFGMVQLAIGVSTSAFTPFLGFLKDVTGSYVTSFHVIGACALTSSVLLLFEPLLRRFEPKDVPENVNVR